VTNVAGVGDGSLFVFSIDKYTHSELHLNPNISKLSIILYGAYGVCLMATGSNTPNNTLTLRLEGDVPLELFATAMRNFSELVVQLSNSVAIDAKIEWIIEDLRAGSAAATIVGMSHEADAIASVVAAYEAVGVALEMNTPIPYNDKVQRAAKGITSVLNGKITSISFETATADATIVSAAVEKKDKPKNRYTYGTVKGDVETLSRRRGFKFTLYDTLFGKAVNCYFTAAQEDIVRNIWGKRVIVSGKIGRDTEGRPQVVREIHDVREVVPSAPGSYSKARGILSSVAGGERAEDIIRRVRDGE
jgi:hypothetical protein